MIKLLRLGYLAALAVLLAPPVTALALDCQKYTYQPASTSEPELQETSFFWEVRYPGAPPNYLLGTFHSADDEIQTAWGKAAMVLGAKPIRVFIGERDFSRRPQPLEVELRSQQAAADLLQEHSDLYQEVAAIFRRYGMPAAGLSRFKPWYIAALLDQAPAMQASKNAPIQDEYLQTLARDLHIPIRGIESFGAIVDYYEYHFSLSEQIRLVFEALCNQALRAEVLTAQTDTYAANDVAEFYRWSQRYTGQDAGLADKLDAIFVEQRNAMFWKEIEPELVKGGAFVAIGNLHLFGGGGIISRIRQAAGVELLALQPAEPMLAPDPKALRVLQSWVAERLGVDSLEDFRALTLTHESVPELRKRLCPGKPCTVEGSYLPQEQTIVLADPVFTGLLRGGGDNNPYAESLLVRELARHILYRRKQDQLAQRFAGLPRADACIRSTVLHWASLQQQAFLRQRGERTSAHVFVLDRRCPDVDELNVSY